MTYTIQITPRANADLTSTLSWHSHRSAVGAGRWHASLLRSVRSLSQNPERWPLADEADDLGLELRELLHGRRPHIYRVLFTIEGQFVIIHRMRHAAQDRLSPGDI